jgi:hypothetical protein
MIDRKVFFQVEKRRNVHVAKKEEWAFNVRFGHGNYWNIMSFESEPTDADVEKVKKMVMRSFEVYHENLHIPPFGLSS